MGVIDSLSAGFRFLGRRVELLLIPVSLDLVLWLVPRLSVAPLFDQFAGFYAQLATSLATTPEMPSDAVDWVKQYPSLITAIGQRTNLLDLLANGALLHVPSLVATLNPLPDTTTYNIANPVAALGLAGLFGLLGILIGVIYLSLLARSLPIGSGPKKDTWPQFARLVLRHWLKIILFIIFFTVFLIALSFAAGLGMLLLSLLSPALGSVLLFVLSGVVPLLLFYLYFVTVGLIMDNLGLRSAMLRSFRLAQNSFWSTLGFIVLSFVISVGFSLLLGNLAALPPAGTLVAILANAYIGSGLAMALLVFYRSQVLRLAERTTARDLPK